MTYRPSNTGLIEQGTARLIDRDFNVRWLLADYEQLGIAGGSTQVCEDPCIFVGIEVVAAGAADSTVTVKDSSNGTDGHVYWNGIVNPSVGALNGLCPRKLMHGLYVSTTTGSGNAPVINILYKALPTD